MTRILMTSAALMLASTASATSPITISGYDPATAHVSYDDLDIHSPSGRVRLENRIRTAADRICVAGAADPAPLMPMNPDMQCYRTAVASGIAQLNDIAGR